MIVALDTGLTYALGALGVVGAAGVTGFITLRLSGRVNAGSTATSDASTLWEASEQMRHDLVADIVAMRADVATARKETGDAIASAATLKSEAERARQEVKALTVVMIDLHNEVARLNAELTNVRVHDQQMGAAVQATRELLAWFTEHGIPPPSSEAITGTAALPPDARPPVPPPPPTPGPEANP